MSTSYDPAAIRAELLPLLATFLTAEQVAEALAVDRDAVARWARKDSKCPDRPPTIPGARKVGGEWRFHRAPFVAWARDWWDPEEEPSFDVWLAALAPVPELQPPIVEQ